MFPVVKTRITLRKLIRAAGFVLNTSAIVAHVNVVGVIEEARRLGIASGLINEGLRVARGEDQMAVMAQTLHSIGTGGAPRCYERLGFVHTEMVDGRFYVRKLQ